MIVSGAIPSRNPRRLAVQMPARNPAATSTPYQWTVIGPSSKATLCTLRKDKPKARPKKELFARSLGARLMPHEPERAGIPAGGGTLANPLHS
jgi:hypothetical protein